MQNLGTLQTKSLGLELFHVQTHTSFEIQPNLSVICIGKPNETINPDVDVSGLPDANIVSCTHAKIQVQESTYYIEDLGSSNGTYLNDIRLEPKTHHPLKLGDKIDLGQGSKVTFIFRHKQQDKTNIGYISNPTVIQPQNRVDRTSKILGASLMVAGILILAASTQVGFFVRLPGVLLSITGVSVLVVGRVNRIIGWLLIFGGIAVIAFTGGIFASINLLSVLVASALFAAGYQLFTSGKVWKYDLQTLQTLVKKHKGN
ncbi:FHA domain-containing protein [Chlorogloeopsis sp. ULAP01]|uniref:FHA domain-containing protein n=1 Tax=Chlorogloeopsis sp. ULAP01 TaxID=3056483 RepID=UPI0025AA638F|nr:FHA domain-containing protein [Chlorogloeopsis sp. ULAP01]MDM9381476.1 FHA domain-containing protein [Chlorogloeopsis sp. ULAP01]